MWQSRKFRTLVFDAVLSTVTMAVTLFLAPEYADKVLTLVAYWQPVFFAMIIGVAVEDSAALKAGTHPNQAK